MNIQYWLVTLDQYGNPTLCDGGHLDVEGANKAMYLYNSLGFSKPDEKYAVAKIEILPVIASDKGVNKEAIHIINNAKMA